MTKYKSEDYKLSAVKYFLENIHLIHAPYSAYLANNFFNPLSIKYSSNVLYKLILIIFVKQTLPLSKSLFHHLIISPIL